MGKKERDRKRVRREKKYRNKEQIIARKNDKE